MSVAKPRVVVGLDFGTTFSGFAFAHISDPEKVYTFFDYPRGVGNEKPYCKTLTGSYYKETEGLWQFKSWGYPARAECARDILAFRKAQAKAKGPSRDPFQPTVGSYLTRFKLHLATADMGASSAKALPPGLAVNVLITDYLREMGLLILRTLQDHYGPQLTKQAIQWCVTVPSIWDNAAKAVMRKCVEDAGLVEESPHPLIMVLEPEAASFSCHKNMGEQELRVGDRLLVADIGGGTADIVVQEIVSIESSGNYRVREVTTSSGGLCGGTYVDTRFIDFLHSKIGPCLEECITQHVQVYALLIQEWENRKTTFGDRSSRNESTDINLPSKLVSMWENWDLRNKKPARDSYDELEISYEEMQSIFDPVVDQNLQLIARQLAQAGSVKVLVVVGGFAGSPYLMERIRSRFAELVPQIISPPNPGSAVCQGAVMLALNPRHMFSRVCKKTYGIEFSPEFDMRRDASKYKTLVDGKTRCSKRFEIYVRKGERVEVDSCISRKFSPLFRGQKVIKFQLFSSTDTDPRYTDEEGARKEGEVEVDISADMALDKSRKVMVSLYFGGSTMEIKAEAVNFLAAKGSQSLDLPVAIGFL